MTIIIYILIAFFSGATKAVSDTLWFWWGNSIFEKYPKIFNPNWWNPRISYKNKYKPKNKFIRLLTSTILVTFTDAWHTFQFLSYFPLFLAISFAYEYGIDIFPLYGLGQVVLFASALYAVRMGGFTFTKALITWQ